MCDRLREFTASLRSPVRVSVLDKPSMVVRISLSLLPHFPLWCPIAKKPPSINQGPLERLAARSVRPNGVGGCRIRIIDRVGLMRIFGDVGEMKTEGLT